MDEQQPQPNLTPSMPSQPVQPVAPALPSQPVPQPPSPAEAFAKVGQQIPTWVIAAAAIVFGLLVLVAIAKFTQKPPVVTLPTPTPTVVITPTPIRTLSPFATTSAFMSLDAAIAAYATAVKGYNTNDPSLSPPVLDLNLGF